MHFDEIMDDLGHGLVQHFVLGCCLLMIALVDFISTGLYYFLPYIVCDLQLSWDQLLFSYTPYLFGICFGSMWFGVTSDIKERRNNLEISCVLFFISCILLSTLSSIQFAGVFLFLLGLSCSGILLGCKIIIFEVLAPTYRGSRYLFIETVSTVSSAAAMALAHSIEHRKTESYVRLLAPIHWRSVIVIAGIFGVFGACMVSLIPNSPRQLFAHHRIVTATIILRRLFAVNKCANEEAFLNVGIDPFKNTETRLYRGQRCSDYIFFIMKYMQTNLLNIFTGSRALSAGVIIFINLILFDGSLLLNSLLSERVMYSGTNCTFSGGRAVNETTWNDICQFKPIFLYQTNLHLALIVLLPGLLLPLLIIFFNRRILLALCCVGAGLGGSLLAFGFRPYWDLILAGITAAFHSAGNAVLQLITLETFPTKFRATALGLMMMVANSTKLVIIFISEWSCFSTLSAIASLFFVCAYLLHRAPVGCKLKMGLTLYSVSDGPPSLAVRMTLEYLGLDFKLVEVDFAAGEFLTEEYAMKNPQKEIPVLDDDGFLLSESIAIIQYLADKYGGETSIYPKDPQRRAIVNHRLAFNLSTYYRHISEYVMAPIFFGYERTALGLKKVKIALDIFNTYLARLDKKFAADDTLTIADFPLVTATLCLEAIGFDLTPYPQIVCWYRNFKTQYPALWRIGEAGRNEITEFDKIPIDLSGLNHPIHPVRIIKK